MDQQTKKDIQAAYRERKVVGGIYAIKNAVNGKIFLAGTTDMNGMKNRFAFSRQTGGCFNLKLKKDWDEFGKEAFTFEVLEELDQNELQTAKEFKADIKTLEEMWLEKFDSAILY